MKYIWQKKNWTNFRWQNEKILQSLGKTRFAQGKLLGLSNYLNADELPQTYAEVMINEAIKTSEIEGHILNKNAVRSSVAKHLGLPTADLPVPDRETDGLVQILIDATKSHHQELSLDKIKTWHAALFPTGHSGLHQIATGQWRGKTPMQVVSGPVGRERIHFQAPPQNRIEKEMQAFIKWWNHRENNDDGLLRAGIAHFRFVTIHPFEDGNGRIARALTDMALARDEEQTPKLYSFSSQVMAFRNSYYDVLEQTQKGDGDITDWLLWFLQCLEHAIVASHHLIEKMLAKSAFWQKNQHFNLTKRQQKVINRLLDAGPDGFEGGLTTKKFCSMTKSSRATAYREISDLVNKGMLKKNPQKGRNVSYRILY
jgi:Fic family protein